MFPLNLCIQLNFVLRANRIILICTLYFDIKDEQQRKIDAFITFVVEFLKFPSLKQYDLNNRTQFKGDKKNQHYIISPHFSLKFTVWPSVTEIPRPYSPHLAVSNAVLRRGLSGVQLPPRLKVDSDFAENGIRPNLLILIFYTLEYVFDTFCFRTSFLSGCLVFFCFFFNYFTLRSTSPLSRRFENRPRDFPFRNLVIMGRDTRSLLCFSRHIPREFSSRTRRNVCFSTLLPFQFLNPPTRQYRTQMFSLKTPRDIYVRTLGHTTHRNKHNITEYNGRYRKYRYDNCLLTNNKLFLYIRKLSDTNSYNVVRLLLNISNVTLYSRFAINN